jgi:pSer/pThr/pTyr-binding forkhead associated (FHA) protein
MTIQNGVPNTGTMPLPGSEFRVGRFASPEVQLALDEKTVSPNHAQVSGNPQTGQYSVQDLGSSFGTFIVQADGSATPVAQGQAYPLANGTVVQFGQVVRVRFNLPGAGGGYPAAPQQFVDNDPYKTQF